MEQKLIYKGKIEDLKKLRFIKSSKDPWAECEVWQKGIGKGINVLIYENGDIRAEISDTIFCYAPHMIEDSLIKMNIPYEKVEFEYISHIKGKKEEDF